MNTNYRRMYENKVLRVYHEVTIKAGQSRQVIIDSLYHVPQDVLLKEIKDGDDSGNVIKLDFIEEREIKE